MIFEPFLENLSIFADNVSIFYIICALVSFLAVWFTWKIGPTNSNIERNEESIDFHEDEDVLVIGDESRQSSMEDRKNLIRSMRKSLTTDDRAKENKVEKQQLGDILNVMKRDGKFSSTTMEELEEQLKLYRE